MMKQAQHVLTLHAQSQGLLDITREIRHDAEGPDDMPAHIKGALTTTQLSIPVSNQCMTLGTWQGIYLFEHRRAPRVREIVLHLIGG